MATRPSPRPATSTLGRPWLHLDITHYYLQYLQYYYLHYLDYLHYYESADLATVAGTWPGPAWPSMTLLPRTSSLQILTLRSPAVRNILLYRGFLHSLSEGLIL